MRPNKALPARPGRSGRDMRVRGAAVTVVAPDLRRLPRCTERRRGRVAADHATETSSVTAPTDEASSEPRPEPSDVLTSDVTAPEKAEVAATDGANRRTQR